MTKQVELDAIDLKILRELQRDGRMTNVDLAQRVGISAPPVCDGCANSRKPALSRATTRC